MKPISCYKEKLFYNNMNKPVNTSFRPLLSLSWQSVAYGIGIFGSQIVMFFTLPLFTHYMSQDEYGAVSVITVLYTFLNSFTNAGLPSGTFRLYHDDQDVFAQRLILSASQFLFFLFSVIPATFIFVFPKLISQIMLGTEVFAPALQITAIYLIVDTMNTFGDIILRVQIRPMASSIQSILRITLQTGTAVLLVRVYNMGIMGYWLGYLIGASLGLILMIWLVRKELVFQISWQKTIELLKYGVPLIPNTLSITALRLADRYLIGTMLGLDQAAVYDIGYKIGSLLNMVVAPFRVAWPAFSFSVMHNPKAPKIYRDALTFLTAGCSVVVLSVVAFRMELVNFLAPKSYLGATSVIGWVAAAQIFLAIYPIIAIGPKVMKKTRYLAWASVFSAVLNIILNFLLIPSIGILGAAIATFFSYLSLIIFTYFIGQRLFFLPIDWVRLGKLLLASIVVSLIIVGAESFSLGVWLERLIKITGILLFPILLLVFGFITFGQSKNFLNLIAGVLNKKNKARQ
ncbi:MAG: oligosaccharide flippase family protein [Anaerolineae bacterium]|jgi:O-antigen/teichoic acid export membrane protein|nr:oligosaccharide flippase family protein [Anaerolineae bacterium]